MADHDDITRLAERDALIAKMIAHHELWAVELADMDSAEAQFHKDAAAELRALAQQGNAVVEGIAGEVVEIGDDESGQPRILIHTTREAIKAYARSLLFKPAIVTIAPQPKDAT